MIKQIVNLITEEREKRGMNKSELARRAGITYRQLLNIENGMNCKVETIEKLLKVLEIKELNVSLV